MTLNFRDTLVMDFDRGRQYRARLNVGVKEETMSTLRRRVGLIEVPGQAPFFQFSGEPSRDIEEYKKVRARADAGQQDLYHIVFKLESYLGDALVAHAARIRQTLHIDEPFIPFVPPTPYESHFLGKAQSINAAQVAANRETLARDAMGRALRRVAATADSLASALVCRVEERVARDALREALGNLDAVRKKHEASLQEMWRDI